MKIISEFQDYLSSKNYARRTIESYTCCLKKFLTHFKDHPKNISTKQIYGYLAQFDQVNTKKQYVGMLRILYTHIYPMKQKVGKIQYPKKEQHIPIILTPEEVNLALSTITNLKHRCIIELTWVCALRISEVQHLQIRHISRNNEIFIENSKGAKDRIVPLPEDTLSLLRRYYKRYFKVVSKEDYLFPGVNGKYSSTSIRNVFNRSTVGINKKVKFHSLRHSRASYWIEQGLSTKEVSNLLGHNSVKTTEIYTHVSIGNLKRKVLSFY